ncbi:MAG: dipicolinate synthase subunit B, partial [Clostridiales bacterium]|nr:dipicolinate synthase subunit B [Clostridiales bacterium]
MSKTRIGFALTGSFCTFHSVFVVMGRLIEAGYDITPILSFTSAREDTRFYSRDQVWDTLRSITGKKPLVSLPEVEPIGPQKLLDGYIIAPCTGASLGKFAHGIYDTPALLGAKSH